MNKFVSKIFFYLNFNLVIFYKKYTSKYYINKLVLSNLFNLFFGFIKARWFFIVSNIYSINMDGNTINKYMFNFIQPFCKQKRYFNNNNNSKNSENSVFEKFSEEGSLKPIYIYEDLHLDLERKVILNNLKSLSGIHPIFNNITGYLYIWSSSINRFYARFFNHLLYFKDSKILKNVVR